MIFWMSIIAGCCLLLGLLRLRKDLRDFLGAIIVSFGVIVLLCLLVIYLIAWTGRFSIVWPIIISYVLGSLLVIGVIWFLIMNTRVMEEREGKTMAGKLSLGMGVNLLFILLSAIFIYQFHQVEELAKVNVVLMTFLMIDFTFVVLFICYLVYSFLYQMVPIKDHMNYIIILGSGIRSEEVTPLLRSRLDKAIQYYKKNNGVKLIVSGGQGEDEPITEAAAMKKYLLSQHIPVYDILEEGRSTTTYENMLFSKMLIEAREGNKDYTVMFTTNNYHVFRAATFAKLAGLKADGVGSPTAFYFLPTAMLREYIGILSRRKLLVAGIILFWLSIGGYILFK